MFSPFDSLMKHDILLDVFSIICSTEVAERQCGSANELFVPDREPDPEEVEAILKKEGPAEGNLAQKLDIFKWSFFLVKVWIVWTFGWAGGAAFCTMVFLLCFADVLYSRAEAHFATTCR